MAQGISSRSDAPPEGALSRYPTVLGTTTLIIRCGTGAAVPTANGPIPRCFPCFRHSQPTLENPRVDGSIPPLATERIQSRDYVGCADSPLSTPLAMTRLMNSTKTRALSGGAVVAPWAYIT